jgi:hypothetical protein
MKNRFDVIRFISYHIVNGKGIKIELDECTLRLEMHPEKPYMIWHNETYNEVAAIINEEQDSYNDYASKWAKGKVEFYDL